MKDFVVSVFNNHTGSNCQNRPLAYLRPGPMPYACVHAVSAETGVKAKQKAIKEHLDDLRCSHADPYCVVCRTNLKSEWDW